MPRFASTITMLLLAALAAAGEALPAPAGIAVLAAARDRAVLGDGAATVRLVRRAGLGLVRVEDQTLGEAVRRRELIGDHLLVRPVPGADPAAIARAVGGAVRGRAGRDGPWLVSVPVAGHGDLPKALAVLAGDARVARVEPDWVVQAIGSPGDPSFGQLWGMHNTGQSGGTADADIDATEAWDVATGDAAVLVGVIDTGIDRNHPDLAANMWSNPGESGLDGSNNDRRSNGIDDDGNGFIDDWRGWDFVNNDNDPADDVGHGTHCAGTIGAVGDNGIGVAGVCWQVSMVGIKFLGVSGGTTAGAIAAVDYARAIGCTLTSNSWGGGPFSQSLSDAIAANGAAGQLFIAAAGNSGGNNDTVPSYPASYPLWNIISVAATDHNDALASFSCYGLTSVDLGAPGVNTVSTLPGSAYGSKSGTSMATPHVAGACALLSSINPSLSASQLKEALLANADPVASLAGKTVTGARLNVNRALLAVAGAQVARQGLAIVEDGNGDGVLNPGESAQITLTLRSAGVDGVVGASGTLSSADGILEILDGETHWGDLPPGTVSAGDGPFIVRLPAGTATPRDVSLLITVNDADGGSWTFPVALSYRTSSILAGHVRRVGTLAPVAGATVTCAGPGGGSVIADGDGAWSLLVTDGAYAVSATTPGLISAGALAVTAPPGGDAIDPLVGRPELAVAPLSLAFTLDQDASASQTLSLANAGDLLAHAALKGTGEAWTATGLWHRAAWRSPPGDTAWYYGRDDTRTYDTGAANSGNLVLPPIRIPAGAANLTFREWRQAETGTGFDLSLLQVSQNGGSTWSLLSQSSSVTSGWRTVTVPIASLAGRDVLLRFRFDTVDAIANAAEGWYIDDLAIDGAAVGSWLTADPLALTVDAGGEAMVTVHADATGLAVGTYSGDVRITSDAPDGALVIVPVTLTVNAAPILVLHGTTVADPAAGGDGDGWPEPGETLSLAASVRNTGGETATGLTAVLHSDDARLTILAADTAFPDLPAGGSASGLTPLSVAIVGDCPVGTVLAMHLAISDGEGRSWSLPLSLTCELRSRISGTARVHVTNLPIAGAVISVAGRNATTAVDGTYAITGVPPGTYTATATASGLAATQGTVVLPPDAVWDPLFGDRQLDITPTRLDLACTRYAQAEGTIGLASAGSLPVTWTALVAGDEYAWQHSGMAGGPVYEWNDISATGTAVAISGDDSNAGPLPLGFQFPFYGNAFASFRVCTNGWISFTSTSTSYSTYPLPSAYAPPNMIAALWADLYIDSSASVHYANPDADRLIVQYTNVAYLSSSSLRNTFQIILHRDGTILLQYQRVDNPSNGTVGVQNATGSAGITIVRNAPLIVPDMAVRIRPVASWLALSHQAGTIEAGATDAITATAAPAGLPSGTFSRRVLVASDDNDSPSQQVEVVLTVSNPNAPVAGNGSVTVIKGTPAPVVLSGSDADGDPLGYTIVIPPQHGALTGTPPALVYQPAAGYLGPDAFTFRVSDGERTSADAIMLLDVQRSHHGPPVGDPAAITTDEDAVASTTLTASDPDEDAIGWRIAVPPAHGSASLVGDVLTYEPDPDWNGLDSITVEPFDDVSTGAPVIVTVTVLPLPDAPTLDDLTATVPSGVSILLSPVCADGDGDEPVLEIVAAPTHGTAVVEGGRLRYTSPRGYVGGDAVRILARDPGGLASPVATVTLDVVTDGGSSSSSESSGGGGGCGAGALGLLALAGLGLRRRRRG